VALAVFSWVQFKLQWEMKTMRNRMNIGFAVAAALFLSACASSHMVVVEEGARVTRPEPGKALVYFVRPTSFGGAIQATLYDSDDYVGTISAHTHMAYQAKPGKHLFMVIGESADFMQADLIEGKTYSAVVQPRMGVWKARFSFQPASGMDQLGDTKQVILGEAGRAWAKDNAASIQEKKAEYLPKWQEKPDSDKQTLRAESGR
jgi:hypothetical protein